MTAMTHRRSRLIHSAPAALALLAATATAQGWVAVSGPAVQGASYAFDSTRGRLVMFDAGGETLEYAGGSFLRRATGGAPVPFPRLRGSMVHDPVRRRTLLLGGIAGGSVGDLWSWDGASWTAASLVGLPPRRSDAAMVYDSHRDRVVLYGGQDLGNTAHFDTWEFDGTRWFDVTPPGTLIVNAPRMAFDSGRGVAVMVGGSGFTVTIQLTLEWNGHGWINALPTSGPVPRTNVKLVYDPLRQVTVMLGGATRGDEIWEWDGFGWFLRGQSTTVDRTDPIAWFDPALGRTVVLGGRDPTGLVSRSDAWSWDGQNLVRLHGDLVPPASYRNAVVQDPVQDRRIVFGAFDGSAYRATWAHGDAGWTRLQPANAPTPRQSAAGVLDPLRGQALLFGGFWSGSFLADLWAWNGSDWAQLSAGPGPQARMGAGFAFDAGRGVAVLFGGAAGPLHQPGGLRNDTWEWNGAAWTQRPTAAAPPPREGPAMAWDPLRQRIALFGGRTGATAADQLDDYWEFDGTNWQRVLTPTVPPGLGVPPQLVHDPTRGVMVLHGGLFLGTSIDYQLWDFDGTDWSLRTQFVSPTTNGNHLSWANGRQRLWWYDTNVVREWTPLPAAANAYGTGCGAPVPLLTVRTAARIGEPEFGLEAIVAPQSPVVFALSDTVANVPIGNGCALQIGAALASSFALAGGDGVATHAIPLPLSPVLRGLAVHVQAGALDPATTALSLTRGLTVVVGD